MSPLRIVVALGALVLLQGCARRPADPDAWAPCVEEGTVLVPTPDHPALWTLGPGPSWLLSLEAFWGYPPWDRRARAGRLEVELGEAPAAGDQITTESHRGIYTENDQGRRYASSWITGTIDVVDVQPDHVKLDLELVAHPSVDLDGLGEVEFDGPITAARKPYAGCAGRSVHPPAPD